MKILNFIKKHRIIFTLSLLLLMFAVFTMSFFLKNTARVDLVEDTYSRNLDYDYIDMLRENQDVSNVEGVTKIGEFSDSGTMAYYLGAYMEIRSEYSISSGYFSTVVSTDDTQQENIKMEIFLATNYKTDTECYKMLMDAPFRVLAVRESPFAYEQNMKNETIFGFLKGDMKTIHTLNNPINPFELPKPYNPDSYYEPVTYPFYYYFAVITVKKGVRIDHTTYDEDYIFGEKVEDESATPNN